jgi:hypothetical protein
MGTKMRRLFPNLKTQLSKSGQIMYLLWNFYIYCITETASFVVSIEPKQKKFWAISQIVDSYMTYN